MKQIVLFRKEDVKFYDTQLPLLKKNGKLFMSVGSGGSTIITSVLQTIPNVSEYSLTQEAVNAPRFHPSMVARPDHSFEPNTFNTKTLKP
jgi:gamma-glutamyltranspeptidase/glutathione hydrolase